MQLIKDASGTAYKLICSNKVQSIYRKVNENAKNKRCDAFCENFQDLFDCLAFVVDGIAISPKRSSISYENVRNKRNTVYLCDMVLHDNELALLMGRMFDEVGRKDLSVNIETCVNFYNRLIKKLVSTLDVPVFKQLSIGGLQQAYNEATRPDQASDAGQGAFRTGFTPRIKTEQPEYKKPAYKPEYKKTINKSEYIKPAGRFEYIKPASKPEYITSERKPEFRQIEPANKKVEEFVLAPNSNEVIGKKLREKSMVDLYKTILYAVNSRNETSFMSTIQSYITRIAIIISNQSMTNKIENNNYQQAIEYLGDILQNNSLKKMLQAVEVNEQGNKVKHTIKNVEADIKECLHQYNRMIYDIINKFGLQAFKICYIKYNYNPDGKKDAPELFEEKNDEKFEAIKSVKFSAAFSEEFTLDVYKKTLNTALVISWPERYQDYLLNVTVRNSMGYTLGKKENIALDEISSCMVSVSAPKEGLAGRKLNVTVKVECFKKKRSTYSTGALFWKKEHEYEDIRRVGEKEFTLSRIY